MKKRMFLPIILIIIFIGAITKISFAQEISFEISMPGVSIVIGDPYPVIFSRPQLIYYEPLPEGSYCYDEKHDCYYDDYGNVYFDPPNVVKHDNGKHKGWYKNGKHKHDGEDNNENDNRHDNGHD